MTVRGRGGKLPTLFGALLDQFGLYAELAGIEWKEEKRRLIAMLVFLLLGFIFLFCALLALSMLVLVFSWDTPYRIWSITGMVGFYGLCAVLSWYRFLSLGERSDEAFIDTREELAADIALLREQFD